MLDVVRSKETVVTGAEWVAKNSEAVYSYHLQGKYFLAIEPNYGVVHSAADEEDFDAWLNDLRPSVLRRLYLTATSLWVQRAWELTC